MALFGQLQLRVAGRTDNGFVTEQGAGVRQRAVGLPQMHANAQARGQFGVIVDDQAGLVAFAQFEQRLGLAQAAGLVAGFVAVLQQGHAAIERGFDVGQEFAGQQLAVGHGIQAT